MSGFVFDENEVRKAIAVFHPDGHIFEVRIISGDKKWNAAGIFDNVETLIDALNRSKPGIDASANVYMTLNKIDPACFDRTHKNSFVKYQNPTVSDKEIQGYDWFFIDLDPVRATGTSSTKPQLVAAWEKAKAMAAFLKERGWPDPVMAHSGNGIHLLYSTGLSTDKQPFVERALKALNAIFSDETIDVDVKVGNPARICKLYGTVAKKGADTKARPHRMSRILTVPNPISHVTAAQIMDVADLLPDEKPQSYNAYNPGAFDLQTWIDQHAIAVTQKQTWSGGTKWILECCPFNPEHKHKDAALIQTNDGKICFNCFHASCADKRWKEFRLFYEPDAYQPKAATPNYQLPPKPAGFGQQAAPVLPGQPEAKPTAPAWLTTEAIRALVVPEEAHILTGIEGIDKRMIGLKKGYVSVLSGLRSAGKSSILSQLVVHCRQQGMKCALFSGEMNSKQVLKWLTLQAAGKNHVHGTQYERVFYPNDDAAEAVSRWLDGFVFLYNNDYGNDFTDLEQQLVSIVQREKLDLVLIDNLMALNVEPLDRDQYVRHTKFIKELKRIAQALNIHILFVAHPRKSDGYLRMNDISGSGDLTNAADNVFIIHRVDDDYKRLTQQMFRWKITNPLYQADNVIEICKDRDTGCRDEHIPLYFEIETKRMRNKPAEYVHYGWESVIPPPPPTYEMQLVDVEPPW